MGFSRDSLEQLRSRLDLVEVLSPHIKLQRTGSSYKALCPFHEEKSPSFVVQKGDSHYHCFGCGAHGDAIQFLMTFVKMSFQESVESLAERFGIHLEEEDRSYQPKGPSKMILKEALEHACNFYQFCLLHTAEGHAALDYLYRRGIDLAFIQQFRFGYAPMQSRVFLDAMREMKMTEDLLKETGLLSNHGRAFFLDRATIPILDATGAVIGFSARSLRESSLQQSGPKYINTPETVLFKKSKVLFGLSYSRKRIAKEKKAMIVEGQIDALRLIYCGFDWTVAGQGTAFGEEHVKELVNLGVRQVTLALDGDMAGAHAAVKIGHLFQKVGIEVWIAELPQKSDPDQMLRDRGPEEWQKLLDTSLEYLPFLIQQMSKEINIQTPAGKNELVQTIAKRIREWDHPLMIHESLRKLARLTQTPESILGAPEEPTSQTYMPRSGTIRGMPEVDADRILEADLLRWLIVVGLPQLVRIAELNIRPEHLRLAAARVLYEKALQCTKEGKACDLLSLAIDLDDPEQQMFLAEILQKRINRERAVEGFVQTVQRILERAWMQQREEIKLKIYSGSSGESEVLALAKQFDELKKQRPQVIRE